MYQVGRLLDYKDDDPTFDDLEEAECYALDNEINAEYPIGVWTGQDEGSELVSIVFQYKIFSG